jgi:hypothetical protein
VTSSLLLTACVCAEPAFLHRDADGRPIACDVLRRLDQQIFETRPQSVHQSNRERQIITRRRDRDRAVVEATWHAGER